MKSYLRQTYLAPLLHIFICLSLLAIPLLDAPTDPHGHIQYPLLAKDVLRYIFLLSFFYLNYLYFTPKLYFEKKYIGFILSILLCYFTTAFLPNLMNLAIPPHPPHPTGALPPPPHKGMPLIGEHLLHNLLSFLVAFFGSFLLCINDAYAKEKAEKANLEFTYLKAQINPHFLFNTLNAIYALAVKKSDRAPEAIQELSGMMRYILHDASRNDIPLQKELEYLDNFIQLQKHRYSYTLDVSYEKRGIIDGQKITPLIIIPFVENAFKHGVSPEEPSKIIIDIHIEPNRLTCIVSNSKIIHHQHSMDQSGIGIHNTKARLQYAYPGRHRLAIREDEKTYSVTLTIDLT